MFATGGIIAAAIEQLAPLALAESWDNVGLLLGRPDRPVSRALLAIDVNLAVIKEAIETGAELIVCHHPFPFQPIKQIRTDTANGVMLSQLLKHDIAVYAAHTNLDRAEGGVNDALAGKLGLIDTAPLMPYQQSLVKIIVFVPKGHEESVWHAMSEVGAGAIGKYRDCSFRMQGLGTFLPSEGSRPFMGQLDQLSTVEEIRMETIAPATIATQVVQALITAHPYEEVAYDIIPLQNSRTSGGLGRIGDLTSVISLREFAMEVKKSLSVEGVRVYGDADVQVSRIAVCGGAGMDCVASACKAGAQVLVTGDIRYHDAQKALAQGICLIDAGHFTTEYPVLETLQTYLQNQAEHEKWQSLFAIAKNQAPICHSY